MPRTEQEQVEQVDRYVELLLVEIDSLWKRQQSLGWVLAVAWAATVAVTVVLASVAPRLSVALGASALLSVVVGIAAWRTLTSVRTAHDRLLSLVTRDRATRAIELLDAEARRPSRQKDPEAGAAKLAERPTAQTS